MKDALTLLLRLSDGLRLLTDNNLSSARSLYWWNVLSAQTRLITDSILDAHYLKIVNIDSDLKEAHSRLLLPALTIRTCLYCSQYDLLNISPYSLAFSEVDETARMSSNKGQEAVATIDILKLCLVILLLYRSRGIFSDDIRIWTASWFLPIPEFEGDWRAAFTELADCLALRQPEEDDREPCMMAAGECLCNIWEHGTNAGVRPLAADLDNPEDAYSTWKESYRRREDAQYPLALVDALVLYCPSWLDYRTMRLREGRKGLRYALGLTITEGSDSDDSESVYSLQLSEFDLYPR